MNSLCSGVSLRPPLPFIPGCLVSSTSLFQGWSPSSLLCPFPPSSRSCRHTHRSPWLQRGSCPHLSSPAKPAPLKRSPPTSIQDEETKTGRCHPHFGLIIIQCRLLIWRLTTFYDHSQLLFKFSKIPLATQRPPYLNRACIYTHLCCLAVFFNSRLVLCLDTHICTYHREQDIKKTKRLLFKFVSLFLHENPCFHKCEGLLFYKAFFSRAYHKYTHFACIQE